MSFPDRNSRQQKHSQMTLILILGNAEITVTEAQIGVNASAAECWVLQSLIHPSVNVLVSETVPQLLNFSYFIMQGSVGKKKNLAWPKPAYPFIRNSSKLHYFSKAPTFILTYWLVIH